MLHAAQAKTVQIGIPVIVAVVDSGGYPLVIEGPSLADRRQRWTPDHLNSAASGLSPTTRRARAGHGRTIPDRLGSQWSGHPG